jgi:hypothetical protein
LAIADRIYSSECSERRSNMVANGSGRSALPTFTVKIGSALIRYDVIPTFGIIQHSKQAQDWDASVPLPDLIEARDTLTEIIEAAEALGI